MTSLAEMAVAVRSTADARAKTALSRDYAAPWKASRAEDGTPIPIGSATPPDRPARPAEPPLLDPREVPRRKPGTTAGRTAILHAVAHIELNAVDLHWDIIARFAHVPMPMGFYDDWVQAADEESKHFNLIADCLEVMESHYGALPAHAGMWRAAEDTAEDFMGRLAVVPMVLEARGLDVTPAMIAKLEQAGDPASAAVLRTIYEDEIGHVAIGRRWYLWLCARRGLEPQATWHELVRRHFRGALKPPFNEAARRSAGLEPADYLPLALEREVS